MKSMSALYERLMRLGVPCHRAYGLCANAINQIHLTNRFRVAVGNGYISGYMSQDGIIVN